jgi:tripartite-type tricarboxylate transporter receptor subunit TctC
MLALVTAPLLSRAASASPDWPNRQGRVIVPYPAGGATDVMGRLAAEVLSQESGQRFIVENKGGASGSIGTTEAQAAPPDGYTFLVATPATHVTNQFLRAKLPYDPDAYEPVVLLSRSAMVMIVHPSVNAQNVADLVALAKREPGKLNFASSGTGATSHLAPELFKKMADVDIAHIPYRGAGPAMNDLIGGKVQLMIDNLQTALPQIRAGAVRALGVSSTRRLPALPDVSPIGDTVPGYEALSFLALVAPKATPESIRLKAAGLIQKAFRMPRVEAALQALGVEFTPGTPEELTRFIQAERLKWGALIRERGLKDES